jgi:hypothetical protein
VNTPLLVSNAVAVDCIDKTAPARVAGRALPARHADVNVTAYPGGDLYRTGDTGGVNVSRTHSPGIRVGFVLFGIGLACLAVTVLPFFWGERNRPLLLNLGCMLAPLGFIVAIAAVIRAGRADQRAALTQLAEEDADSKR